METHTIAMPPNQRAQLGEVLLQMSDEVLDAINAALKECNISESKFALLLMLFNTGTNQPLQPSEIANRLGIRRASVTKQLIWLEEHHFITRNICPEDQRMVNVVITAEGYRLLAVALPKYWEACAALTSKITLEETSQLLYLLRKLDI